MKKKIVTLAMIALGLTGCAWVEEPRAVSPAGYEEVHKTLTDGRTVIYVGAMGGGVSCDWANAH